MVVAFPNVRKTFFVNSRPGAVWLGDRSFGMGPSTFELIGSEWDQTTTCRLRFKKTPELGTRKILDIHGFWVSGRPNRRLNFATMRSASRTPCFPGLSLRRSLMHGFAALKVLPIIVVAAPMLLFSWPLRRQLRVTGAYRKKIPRCIAI